MTSAALRIDSGTGPRRVVLSDYLDARREEEAARSANAWIKSLRQAAVDGQPLRRRFTYRDDSLWWFTELYFHKQQVVLGIFRTLAALDGLFERERPLEMRLVTGGRLVRGIAPQFARLRRVRFSGRSGFGRAWVPRLLAMDARASWLTAAALASRLRRRAPGDSRTPGAVVGVVHRAFWRPGGTGGGREGYIGPVLEALERRLAGKVHYVSVGPSENFRARHWWDAIRAAGRGAAVDPIEDFAPIERLRDARHLWRQRHRAYRMLADSSDLRRLAVIHGCDCWPVIRAELAGISLLQWPWSARAMDEAAAALDLLQPRAVLTYAEAGGWGRALILECRRRHIPTVGVQHGFIYRHWLNYLHEADEMEPDPAHPADAGFPRPTLTLLFDEYAAHHLERCGHFPRAALAVTGSPRLDDLVREAASLPPEAIARAKNDAGATGARVLVLVVTKYREARDVLPPLVDAVADMPDVHLAIKTHPAETPEVYAGLAAGRASVRVLDASARLAPLLRASRAVVTVNSTVALDAGVLGVPALVIGLPNNLSPFVEAGAMAGARVGELRQVLGRILYDEEFRHQMAVARERMMSQYAIGSNGGAADRAADAIVRLIAEVES
jgi:hypothetical protein